MTSADSTIEVLRLVSIVQVEDFDAIRRTLDAKNRAVAAQASRDQDEARRSQKSFGAVVARALDEASAKLQPVHGFAELPVRFEPSGFGFDLRSGYRQRVATGLRAVRCDPEELAIYPVVSFVRRGDRTPDQLTTFYLSDSGDWCVATAPLQHEDAERATRVEELACRVLCRAAARVQVIPRLKWREGHTNTPVGDDGTPRYWDRPAIASDFPYGTSRDARRVNRWVDELKSAVAEAESLLPGGWVVCHRLAVTVRIRSAGNHCVWFDDGHYGTSSDVEQVGEWLVRAAMGDVTVVWR
jgi:hypothetical protein